MNDTSARFGKSRRAVSLGLLASFFTGLLLPYFSFQHYNEAQGIFYAVWPGWQWSGTGWILILPFGDTQLLAVMWLALPLFLIGCALLLRGKYRISTPFFAIALALQSLLWVAGDYHLWTKYSGAYLHAIAMFVAYSFSTACWVESVVLGRIRRDLAPSTP